MRLRSNGITSQGSENMGRHHHECYDNVMLSVEMATTEQYYYKIRGRSMCFTEKVEIIEYHRSLV